MTGVRVRAFSAGLRALLTSTQVPHDSRHPCYCGHYLHSHVPRSEEHQHVVASGNAQWHKGPMPQNLCACFYSVRRHTMWSWPFLTPLKSQRKWNQGSICICTGPWVGHGFWEGDERYVSQALFASLIPQLTVLRNLCPIGLIARQR